MPLRPYQEAALHDVGEHFADGARSVCLVMPTGCHAAGQAVLRFDGTIVPVETIEVGDLLMGPDSEPRRVLQLIRGHGEMFRVVPVKGEPFTATRDHVLTLVRTNTGDDPRAGELIDVSLNEWMTWSKYQKHIHKLMRTGVYFPKRDVELPLAPYFLGVLLGDGSLRNTIGISKPDSEVIELCRQEAAQHGLHVTTTGIGNSVTHNLSKDQGDRRPNPLIAKIRALGLRDTDSGSKFIPAPYLTTSRFQRLSILAGLIDADGSLGHSGFDFISKSERLANDVAFLARSVGLAAYVTPCRKGCQTGAVGTYYRVYISGDVSVVPCRIPRKQSPPRRQIKNVLRTGFSVEPIGNAAFYGFTLDGDGRYLLGDFTVTHNSGKSVCASSWLTDGHDDTGLFLVHRDQLRQQAFEHLERALPGDVGIIGPRANPNPDGRLQVATIQTLLARNERPDVKRILADECHHFAADEWRPLLDAYPDAKILGLTATPERQDGRPLGDIFEHLVVGARYPELVGDGHLVKCRAYAPPEAVDGGIANDPIEMYRRYGEDSTGFLFADSIQNAELWAERFSEAGIRAVAVHQRTPARDRIRIMDAFAGGQIRILCNVFLFTEGTDVPAARVCILARPVTHVSMYLQVAGRVLRPAPGKPDAILIDLCGSVHEHGLPTMDRTYSLDGRAISRTVDSVRQCPQCGAVHDGSPPVCDLCGFVFPVAAQSEPAPPRIYDIELREVYAGDATPEPAKRREFERLVAIATERDYALSWVVKQYARLFHEPPAVFLAELPEEAKRREYDKLAALQRERGYRVGFIAVRYKELFGTWPPRAWATPTPAPAPRPAFIAWLAKQSHWLANDVRRCTERGCLQARLATADRSMSEAAVLYAHFNEDHGFRGEDAIEAAVNDYRREFLPGTAAPSAPSLADHDVPF